MAGTTSVLPCAVRPPRHVGTTLRAIQPRVAVPAHHHARSRRRQPPVPTLVPGCHSRVSAHAAASNDQQELDAAAGPSLTPPVTKHQPQLTGKERAALRARGEALAKDKSLQRLQVGAAGITHNVLLAAMDVLMKHQFLRVKLGEGCGLERKATAALLAELLDAAVVGQVGFTITLYRQSGLPRPDNLLKPPAAAAAGQQAR